MKLSQPSCPRTSRFSLLHGFLILLAAGGLLVLSSCAGGGGTPAPPPGQQPQPGGGFGGSTGGSGNTGGTVGGGDTLAPPPVIGQVNPSSGPSSGGTTITITGSNFVQGAVVVVGGKNALQVTFVNSGQITAVTPANVPGAVEVQVRNPDGQRGLQLGAFTYVAEPAPIVHTVLPNNGPTSGGTDVIINGLNFQQGAAVLFGGTLAVNVVVNSAQQITATTPARPAGTVTVTVRNPDSQTGTLANSFTYTAVPAPVVLTVNPNAGTTAGGTSVTITGENFQPGATVLFGGVVAPTVVVVSPTQINVLTPARAAGLVSVTVRNPDNQSGSRASAYTYVAPPVVTSVSPASGSTDGGTTITIDGSNFTTGMKVFFRQTTLDEAGNPVVTQVEAVSVTFVSTTRLRAVTPAGLKGTVDILVVGADGVSTGVLPSSFTFFAPSGITSVTPSSGPASGGTTVTIIGTNFQSGSTVRFGSAAATSVTFVSATELRAVTPVHAPGTVDVTVNNPDMTSGTLPGGFTFVAAPTVTGINPESGPTAGGTSVTITGTGFQSGATVSFDGTAAAGVVVVSPTEITAVTPARAAGVVGVTVTNPDGQSGTLGGAFTYTAGPTLTAIAPASGKASGGTTVVLTGTGFQSGATVSFGGTPASSVSVDSATQITATTPARAAGTVDVAVTNPDAQSATLAGAFTFVAAPTVTSVNPASGPTAGGTSVTVNGTGFATMGAVTVLFGGSPATGVAVTSSTQLTATTPAHAAGVVGVQVINPDDQSGTLANAFTFVAPPTVSSVAPNSGPLAGGTAITITGTGFQPGATVTINGTPATGVNVDSATTITATTPASATAGSRNVTVTNPDGQSGVLAGGFNYEQEPAPVVDGVNPNSGPTAGGTAITISGANFQPGAGVTVNGGAASSVVVVSATTITAVTPAGAAGDATVTVTNPDTQSGALPGGFTYVPPPVVTSISPASGPVTGGTNVTITGSGFQGGATVNINGGAATSVNVVSATTITAVTPAGPAGLANVTVTNPDGQSGTLANGFEFQGPPTVTSVDPDNGTTAGGTAVTITGTNFRAGAAVTMGGAAASSVMVVSATTITAVTPPRAAGAVSVTVTNSDGQSGTLAAGFTYNDPAPGTAPTVAAIAPNSGPTAGGTAVTVTGSDFDPAASLFIGGIAAVSVVVVNDTTITATTPPGAAGSADVTVVNPDGLSGTLSMGFTYLAPPAIASVSPNSGPAAGGTSITITGSGFRAGATVTVGGNPATSVVVVSASTITAVTPAGAPGAANVTVTNDDAQSATAAGAFTYVAAPTITNVSPASGPTAGGTNVVLTGTGFQNGATVTFGGTAAAAVTFISSTEVRTTTPARAAGTVDVVLTNPDTQSATAANAFEFIPPPVLTTVAPASGPAAGGTEVTLTGTDFRNGATVTFGSTAATSVIFDSATQLRATTPMRAAGTVNVTVRNPDNQASTLNNAFTFVAPPSVTGVSPASGPTAGGTNVTITGTGFQSGATVTVGGNPASGVVFNSATQLTAVTPAGAEGAATVTVTNPDTQSGSLASAFNYVAPPAMTSLTPASGPTAGGTTVTITGSKFQSGAAVTFGGTAAASVTFDSATQLRAVTPARAAGTVDVVVTNPDGQSATLANSFTFVPPPTVTAVNPTSGPTAGGTSVTITGTNFVNGATVRFGTTSATSVTFVNATTLTAVSPPRSAGTVSVTVTNPDGQAGSLANAFTYVAPPSVTSVSPSSGPTGGGTNVTINGSSFQNGATVSFGGTAATGVTFVSSTQLTAVTPAQPAGTVSVTVTNPDGQSATLTNGFTYSAGPVVTAVSPTSGPNTGLTLVTITGSNFVNGLTVAFGSAQATVIAVSATEISAQTPAHPAGTVNVTVQNPDGQSGTLADAFTFVAVPSITSVTPNSGPIEGGTQVTIRGANFALGAIVLFGTSAAASVNVVDSTEIRCVTTAHAAGTVSVTVANPAPEGDEENVSSGTLSNGFTYTADGLIPPLVSVVTPDAGPDTGGDSVTISGENFQSGATAKFGATNSPSVTFLSSTSLVAITPQHAEGTVAVEVRNPDSGSGKADNAFTFRTTSATGAVFPTLPELPRSEPDITMPNTAGYQVINLTDSGDVITNGANLQNALSTLNCSSTGVIIQLPAGVVFRRSSGFIVPIGQTANCGSNWVIIRTSAHASLPPPGTRVTQAHAPLMPRLEMSNANADGFFIRAENRNIRLVGLYITPSPTASYSDSSGSMVQLGESGSNQDTIEKVPQNLIVDRSILAGVDERGNVGGVEFHCGNCGVVDSRIEKIHRVGFDNQGIRGWNATGPILIQNNFIEGAAMCVLFGGAGGVIQGVNPSDITFRRNHCFKPFTWMTVGRGIATNGISRTGGVVTVMTRSDLPSIVGQGWTVTISGVTDTSFDGQFVVTEACGERCFRYNQAGPDAVSTGGTSRLDHPTYEGRRWTVKNIFELKTGVRVLVEDNILENVWDDGQVGYAFLLKTSTTAGSVPWALTRDVTIRFNQIIYARGGITWARGDSPLEDLEEQLPLRLHAHDNLWMDMDPQRSERFGLLGARLREITVNHNTFVSLSLPVTDFFVSSAVTSPDTLGRIALHNNIFPRGANATAESCSVDGVSSPCYTADSWHRNLVFNTVSSNCTSTSRSVIWNVNKVPQGCPWVDISAVRFANPAARDFRLCRGPGNPVPSCTGASTGANAGTDGKDVGADMDALTARTCGARSGDWRNCP